MFVHYLKMVNTNGDSFIDFGILDLWEMKVVVIMYSLGQH